MRTSNHWPRSGSGSRLAARTARRLLASSVAVVVVGLALPPSAGAVSGPVRCGETVTVDTRLTNDLIACPGLGIVIGADDITLDLNGHTVDGDGIGDFEGIQSIGHHGVTIENGSIRQFVEGVAVIQGNDMRLRNLRLADHRHVGILVAESGDVRIEHSTAVGIAASGFFVARSEDIEIQHNSVSRSGGGVAARVSERIHVAHNTLSRNLGEGIALFDDADRSLVEKNTVGGNGTDGIVVTSGSDHNVVRQNSVVGSLGGVGIADADLTRTSGTAFSWTPVRTEP